MNRRFALFDHVAVVLIDARGIDIPGHYRFGAALSGNAAEAPVVGAQIPHRSRLHLEEHFTDSSLFGA